LDSDSAFPGWNALLPCIGTAFVIYGGSGNNVPFINQVFATRLLSGIGLISYSLYLVHWPLIAFLRYIINRELLPMEAIALSMLAIALAYLSWRYVEQPFRHLPARVAPKAFSAAVVSMLILVSVGGGIVFQSGVPQRFPDFQHRKIAGVEDWGGSACFNQNVSNLGIWDSERCHRTSGTSGNVLVWGDSFAAHYMPGILANAELLNANIYQYTFAGCPPIIAYFSLARRACSEFNSRALQIINDYDIDMVVLSARWSDVKGGKLGRLQETIDAIKAQGVQVAVIGPSPQFPAEVQRLDYVLGNSLLLSEVKAEMTKADHVRDAVMLASKGAIFIDPLAFLCHETCTYRDDQDFLYADYGHFSKYGATIAVNAYFPRLAAIVADNKK
jgi:hypothetical protein